MLDLVVIGGVTQDIFFFSPDFKVVDDKVCFVWGEKFVVGKMTLSPGGGGANAAVAFSRLGLNTALWARVGDDIFGQAIKDQLGDEGVDLRFLEVDSKCQTAISTIMSGPSGERTIVMYRGEVDLLNLETERRDGFWDTSWLYVGDLTGDLSSFENRLFEEASSRGIKIAFIPGQQQLDLGIRHLAKVLEKVEIFVLNLYEACTLLGKPYLDYEKTASEPETVHRIEELLQQLLAYGPKIVVITKGPDGSQAYDGKEFHSRPASDVITPLDTTGAGDAFATGFVAASVMGLPVEKALSLGTANARSVISQYGAQSGLLRSEDTEVIALLQ